MRRLAAVFPILLLAAPLRADVIVFRNGDRLTARILSEGTRTVRVQTPFGRLAIPRARIDRIVREDGREDPINPLRTLPPKEPPPPPPDPPARLVLVITGSPFWQAWSPGQEPASDPTLRLQVWLDEEPVATFVDETLDDDIPGAVTNTFSFLAPEVSYTTAPDVKMEAPDTRPGRVVLKLDVPRGTASRRLSLAYQRNEGTPTDPSWRDAATTVLDVSLKSDAPTLVELRQDRGRMEFSRKKMRNVETFHIEARVDTAPGGR